MAYVPTGRATVRRESSGTFDLRVVNNYGYSPSAGFGRPYHQAPHGSWEIHGGLITFYLHSYTLSDGITWNYATDISVSFGGSDSDVISAANIEPGAGTWSCYWDAEEVSEISVFANFAPGTGEVQISARTTKLSLRPKLGGEYFATLSIPGGSVTVSGTIGAGDVNVIDPLGGFTFNGSIGLDMALFGAHSVATANLTGTVEGIPLGAVYTYTGTLGDGGTQTLVYDSGLDLEFENTATLEHSYLGARLTQVLKTQYRVKGEVATPTGVFPDTLKAKVYNYVGSYATATLSPSLDQTYDRYGYTAYRGTVYSAPSLVAVSSHDDSYGVRMILDLSDTPTAAEATNDDRVLFRLPVFDGPTIGRSTRIVLDDCSSATNWTGATEDSGALSVDTSTATRVVATYLTPKVSEAGRFLAFKINPGTTGAKLGIRIQSAVRTYAFNVVCGTAGTATDVEVDLCGPLGGKGGAYFQGSRWPDSPVNESVTWGLNEIHSITIDFPSGSGTFAIEEIALIKHSAPKATTLTSNVGPAETSDPDSRLFLMALSAEVDGRVALEIPGVVVEGVTFTRQTLSDLATWITAPGWSYSLPSGSEWYRIDELSFLGGSGAIVTSGGTTSWTRNEWDEASPIPMQAAVDALIAYPDCGDALGGGSYGGPLICRFHKILRGAYWGLVIGSGGASLSGETVESLEGGSSTGTATSDSDGRFYLTGDGNKDGVSTTVRAEVGTDPGSWLSGTTAGENRSDHRAGFRVKRAVTQEFYRVAPDLTHYRGFEQDGTVRIGFAANADPSTFTNTDSTVEATWVSGAASRTGDRRMVVMYGDGGTVYLAAMNHETGVLEMPITLGNGVFGEPVASDDGSMYAYFVEDGTLKCQILDGALTVVETFDTDLTDLDDAPVSFDDSIPGPNGWRVGVQYSSGGVRLMAFSENGRNFT